MLALVPTPVLVRMLVLLQRQAVGQKSGPARWAEVTGDETLPEQPCPILPRERQPLRRGARECQLRASERA